MRAAITKVASPPNMNVGVAKDISSLWNLFFQFLITGPRDNQNYHDGLFVIRKKSLQKWAGFSLFFMMCSTRF